MQETIYTGQTSVWAWVGLGLFAGSRRSDSPWWPALGVALIALKPQSAVPIFAVLVALRLWPILLRAATIVVGASVPGLLLFARAAGSTAAMTHTVRTGLDYSDRLSFNNLRDPTNNRIDLAGVLSHLHGPALYGLGWAALLTIVLTAIAALALRGVRVPSSAGWLLGPVTIAVIALYVELPLYHQPYDALLLFAGPVAALRVLRRDWWPLYAGGAVLLLAELAFRASLQARWESLGFSHQAVGAAAFTAPTLVAIALTVGAGVRRLPPE